MSRIHDIPLLLLVAIAAGLAFLFWFFGFAWLAQDIAPGGTYLLKSVAGLAKDALFVPLKPLMYALIILSIGSSLAISHGGLGAKFFRVLGFFALFSLIGLGIGLCSYLLFQGETILPDPSTIGAGAGDIKQTPFLAKIYGVLTSSLMICIYTGVFLGGALRKLDLGLQADKVSDLFISGFRKFLQYTIPLAVFGSITLALNSPGGVSTLSDLLPLLKPYLLAMVLTWFVVVGVTAAMQGLFTTRRKCG